MKKDTKIYIAGHRGLVGSAILRRLCDEGYANVIMRTHSELELMDQVAVHDFFSKERPEYVFLAAAKVGGIHANNAYRAEFIYENLMVQSNVLHQSYLHGVKKLLFLGSSCIYPQLAPQPIKEDYLMSGPLEPTNSSYAVSKIAGIEMCWAYNRQYNTQFIPVMPTNLYGPNDNFDLQTSHVLPALIRKIHLAKLAAQGDRDGIERDEVLYGPIPEDIKTFNPPQVMLWGSGNPRREFLHVDDMADASIYVMNLPEEKLASIPRVLPEIEGNSSASPLRSALAAMLLNIGAGEDGTIRELAELIRDVVGFEGEFSFDTSKPDGTPQKLLDVSRLKALGWAAKTSLRDGIESTYKWYLEKS